MPQTIQTPVETPHRRLYTALAIGASFALVGLLAACGGGKGEAGTEQTATILSAKGNGETATTTAEGTTRPPVTAPPRSEIINGIIVPPEPNPVVNNATLAGVDANGNGVRDDVERKIATNAGANLVLYPKIVTFARSEQALISNPSSQTKGAYITATLCGGLKAADSDLYTKLLLNTQDRVSSYRMSLAGIVVTGKECK